MLHLDTTSLQDDDSTADGQLSEIFTEKPPQSQVLEALVSRAFIFMLADDSCLLPVFRSMLVTETRSRFYIYTSPRLCHPLVIKFFVL
ncbi:hypothetical protein H6F61_24590 [Cyanobacteria bacterium FACHB-472]|nr:hypothetical protein [Cyanobacteria bacterium FACHB-472]